MTIEQYLLDIQTVTWDDVTRFKVPLDYKRGTVSSDYDGEAWNTVDGFTPMDAADVPGKLLTVEWRHEVRWPQEWSHAGRRALIARTEVNGK